MSNKHISVLLEESIDALNIKPNGLYFDGTFGRGGHSKAILQALGEGGCLFATDRDPKAAETAVTVVDKRFVFRRGEFSCLDKNFPEISPNSLDGILLDLGVSSPQLDEAERGFSFTHDGELDMRMNPEAGLTAKDFVNNAEFSEIANVIARMGEERFAKQIARKIEKVRQTEMIATTNQLAEIVKSAVPARFHVPGRHPATRTFQAIRIHVNRELDELQVVLEKAYRLLKPKGRLVVISFHSLEDNYVKRFVKSLAGQDVPPEVPIMDSAAMKKVKLIGRPVRPSAFEVSNNPRSRSSLMRIIEKL
ncbi:MAG: 16S rRNA (cytosine(1402)-N(4))-methyltransferase RsmH [Gammaproteobacteria bacterium]|nr:16S rRNA (cytosine(1402)-N(4))-methyltransferase RsmH [Gammaproteobacteria bacterium]